MGDKYNKIQGQTGSVRMVSPDGKTSEHFPASVMARQQAEGWTVAGDQSLSIQTPQGQTTVTPESVEQLGMTGTKMSVAPLVGQYEESRNIRDEEEYGDRALAAAGLGAARGLTFGASDAILSGTGLVEQETLEGLSDRNVGASLAGEFVPLVATTLATGGTGLGARMLQKTPAGFAALKAVQLGEKSTKAFVAANAAESALYGAGHALSQAVIHDEPLTAESLATDTAFGGIFGGVGAAGFKGIGKLYSKGKEAFKGGSPLFDATTEDGVKFLRQTSTHLEDSVKMGDDLLIKTDPAGNRITHDEWGKMSEWNKKAKDINTDLSRELEKNLGKYAEVELPKAPTKVPEPPKAPGAKGPKLDPDFDDAGRLISDLDSAVKIPGQPSQELAADLAKWEEQSAAKSALQKKFADSGIKGKAETSRFHREAVRARQELGLENLLGGDTIASKLSAAKRAIADEGKSLAKHMDSAEAFGKAVRNDAKASKVMEPTSKAANAAKRAQRDYDKYLEEVARYEEKLATTTATNATNAATTAEIKSAMAKLDAGNLSPVATEEVMRFLKHKAGPMASYRTGAAANHELASEVAKRAKQAVTPDGGWARDEYAKAVKELKESLGGSPNMDSMNRVMNGGPEGVERFRAAANRHYEAIADLAQVTGDPKLLKAAKSSADTMRKFSDGAMTPEMKEASKHLGSDTMAAAGLAADYALEGGPLDSVAKVATVVGLARGRGGKKAQGLFGRVFSSGNAGAARSLVKGPGLVKAGLRTGTGRFAYEATQGAMGSVWSPARLFQASGRATSAITQSVQRMLSGAVKASMGGMGAKAALKAMQFNEDTDEKSKESEASLAALFKQKSEQLIKFGANPEQLAMIMYEQTEDLRGAHPTLGDKTEVNRGLKVQVAMRALPRDPGNQHIMGKSTWRPSDLQVQKFANTLAGLMDPIGTFDGITDGTVSWEAARAVEEGSPATFAALQMEVAKNADAIRENLSYAAQNRLSAFMGVPVNSLNSPESRKFIAEQYTQAQSARMESSKSVDANALLQGTPTQAQQIAKRGAK